MQEDAKDAAPTGQAAPASAAEPTAYELKYPEGVAADDATFGKFKELAQKTGLKADGAQQIVDFFVESQKAASEQQKLAVEQAQKQWVEAAKADKEFGGPQFDANIQVAQKALHKFGDSEITELLERTGLGNHPAFVRWAYRIGKSISEDSIAGASAPGTASAAQSDDAFLRGLYPNTPSLFRKE